MKLPCTQDSLEPVVNKRTTDRTLHLMYVEFPQDDSKQKCTNTESVQFMRLQSYGYLNYTSKLNYY
jgi:hypothetical protein